jgi:hypothetical protein
MIKPIIGVNILRVCRQIYNEAVTYAYTNCTWSLGAPLICTDCLIRFPRGTVEKIQHVRLHIRVYICSSTTSPVMRITMSDLIKMKSLRSLELILVSDPEWPSDSDVSYCDSTLLVGLVCQILSQVPTQVKVVWISLFGEWKDAQGEELGTAMGDITEKYAAIKGCNCATST